MDTYIDLYINYLETDGRKAKNTLEAYKRDIKEFHRHITSNGVKDVTELTNADVVSFMMKLKSKGRSGSTVNRKMASVRSYTTFLCREKVLKENPADDIKPPHIERRDVEYLTIEEVEAILSAPDDSVKGLRDKAILEMMYGTGVRVSEISEIRLDDINFRIGFITCSGEYGKARIIPLGRPCKLALEQYVDRSRKELVSGKSAGDGSDDVNDYLFVNYHGEKLTRQGLWKIVRIYAEKAGVNKKLTPQILRNSFAVHMVQNGADLKSIQELMGYEDITTAQVYLSVTKNRIKEVYDKTHPRA